MARRVAAIGVDPARCGMLSRSSGVLISFLYIYIFLECRGTLWGSYRAAGDFTRQSDIPRIDNLMDCWECDRDFDIVFAVLSK